MSAYEQMELFKPEKKADPRPPVTITWNMHHGCTRVSQGCQHCYMFRRDESVGKDPTVVRKTQAFNLPVRKLRSGPYKGLYKIPAGSMIYTCFSSDFFHPAADEWRGELWDMMRERSDCTFFMITKRPERIKDTLPPDWGEGYENVHISVTCESQYHADRRLPVFLPLPIRHKSITHEPMLGRIDITRYLERFKGQIESVTCGGESGPEARICDFSWVLYSHMQCVEAGVPFHFHQTGAKLLKGGKLYNIAREHQHEQARKSGLDYNGSALFSSMPGE